MPLSLSESIIPLEYNLDLTVDHVKPNFKGQLTVLLKPRSENQQPFTTFKLHSSQLVISSAVWQGTTKLSISYDQKQQTASFTSEEPLCFDTSSGSARAELSVTFLGRVKTIKTHREPTTGLFKTNFMNDSTGKSDSYVIATHTQPVFARTIFPCFDEPNSKCKYTLTLTTHKRFKVAANTAIVEQKLSDQDNQLQTVKFATSPLMNPSFFGFCIGDLQFLKSEIKLNSKTIPLQLFAPQGIAHAAYSFDTIIETLPLVEKKIGFDYPLDKLDVVLLPFLSDMAMENWGLLTFQMNHLLLSPQALADPSVTQQVRQLIGHELCHQWMGNYISFDSWEYLWFNESFATWFACDLFNDYDKDNYWGSDNYFLQMENTISTEADESTKSIVQGSSFDPATLNATSDALSQHHYNKGISLLRSLYESIGKEHFSKALSQIFNETDSFHAKCVKPIDIFKRMGEILNSENIPNFFSSWTRTPGIPIVSVSVNDEQTTLEQHRFITEKSDIEDVPYHVPIFGLLPSGEKDEKNDLLTDRTLKLPGSELIINSGAKGLYRVSYESEQCYQLIGNAIKTYKLSEIDIFKIFVDLHAIIGTDYQKTSHINGLITLLKYISSDIELDHNILRGLSVGLDTLQTIESALKTYKHASDDSFTTEIYMPLWKRLSWNELSLPPYQLQVMSKVMFALKKQDTTLTVANQLMKKIMSGPNGSVPLELCGSVFSTVSCHQKSVKQWKKLYELVKSSKGIETHINGGTSADIQNLALENLAFSTNEELIGKTLNFVKTNITSTSVENALFGLNFNFHEPLDGKTNKLVRDVCWDWFSLNFDQWAPKSLREGVESHVRMKKTLVHISFVIFQMWMDRPEKINEFVVKKTAMYGKIIGLDQVWNSVKSSEKAKMNIYKGILGF